MSRPFGTFAPLYRERGLYPRQVRPGTKIPSIMTWQTADPEIASGQLQDWLSTFAAHGIGVVTGSPLPDGTLLGALDIDRDDYVPVAQALLRGANCGRIGARGAVFFVRVQGNGRYRPFTVKREGEPALKVGGTALRSAVLRSASDNPSRNKPPVPLDRHSASRGDPLRLATRGGLT